MSVRPPLTAQQVSNGDAATRLRAVLSVTPPASISTGPSATKRVADDDGPRSALRQKLEAKLLMELPEDLKVLIMKWLRADQPFSELYRAIFRYCATSKKTCPPSVWAEVAEGIFGIENSWKEVVKLNGILHFERLGRLKMLVEEMADLKRYMEDEMEEDDDVRFDGLSVQVQTLLKRFGADTKNTLAFLEYCLVVKDVVDYIVKYVPSYRKDYAQLAKTLILMQGSGLSEVDDSHPQFENIVLSVVARDASLFQEISDSEDTKLAIEAVKTNFSVFNYIREDRPGYKDIALAAAEKDGYFTLRKIKPYNEYYTEIAIRAIQSYRYGDLLQIVDRDARGYTEIAIEAVKYRRDSFSYVQPDYPAYLEIATEAVKHFDGDALKQLPENYEPYLHLVKVAVEANFEALSEVDYNRIGDAFFDLAAAEIRKDPIALAYVPASYPRWQELAGITTD
jgi:hypothetical protein